ncbi:head-tail adaptor protein [Aestuariibius sp. 2305UL40-4]|uniref:phage head completion protein n=1 Tax=Aestuariibius violaceus TaxID=3234132 RepID=UPI00345E4427
MAMQTRRLIVPVAFDAGVKVPDGYGGDEVSWQEAFRTRAEFRYESGRESVDGGGLTGTAVFKVRIRTQVSAEGLTMDHRMRDLIRGIAFNIREIDRVTDRLFIWLVVEKGVAL